MNHQNFLHICSIKKAARLGTLLDLLMACTAYYGKLNYTSHLVDMNVFQLIISGLSIGCSIVGILTIFNRRRTWMLVFILLDSLCLILNILAWLIILMYTSKMKLHEALCDTPGDCPVVFNKNFVIAVTCSSIYGLFWVCNAIFLSAYIQYLRFLERERRELENVKRVANSVTTDVQTSAPTTPKSHRSTRTNRSYSRSALSHSHSNV